MRCFPGYIVLLAALTLVRCSIDNLAGGGSDLPDKVVVGKIFAIDKLPAANTQVALIPIRYNSITDGPIPAALIDTTDSSGAYRINRCPAGDYNIQAVHLYRRTRLLIAAVTVAGDTTGVPADTLRPPGAVKVMLPAGVDAVNGYVYVPGTFCFTRLKSGSGFVILDSVPVCKYADVAYGAIDAPGMEVLRYGVTIISNETASVWNPGWPHARTMVLNTAASGAGVTATVTGFPVLVRLTAGNFDFTQARNSGEDIRFAKRDNTFLPYEIERWDAIGKRAEIWVKVDTVRGSDSAQSISMYWGNADAAPQSASESVFDTAHGFQGVWHLGQTGNATAFDATANHYDGTPSGMSASSQVEGMIGGAQRFNGASSYITLKATASGKLSFPQNGTYTLSAWVYTEVIDSQAHYIISKSNKNYNLDLSAYNLWETYSINNGVGCESNFTPPHLQQWKYLTGVRNGTDQRIYVDGICVDSTITLTTGVTVRDSTFNVQIGKRAESAYGYWNGMIDEVNIANVSRSADWIRLCYMNQRGEDMLVVFK